MPRGELKIKLHGLAVDNGLVRAEVFEKKLRALIAALKAADRRANGRASHDFLITGLEIGSACVTLRERAKVRRRNISSGMQIIWNVLDAVKKGAWKDPHDEVARQVAKVATGAGETFDYAELDIDGEKTVVDAHVAVLADELLSATASDVEQMVEQPRYFVGRAFGSFDGVLKAADSLGTVRRGKLVLTAGGAAIDCTLIDSEHVRSAYERRIIAEGLAHYDGSSALPVTIEIRNVKPVKEKPKLSRWRGAFFEIEPLLGAEEMEDDQAGKEGN